jgi:hypothetical protein
VPGEQGPRGDGEVTATRLAAPSWMTGRASAGIADYAATTRTDRLVIGLGPAQAQEHVFDPALRHAHDLGHAERTRRRRKQEMLHHDRPLQEDQPASFFLESADKVQVGFARWRLIRVCQEFRVWGQIG